MKKTVYYLYIIPFSFISYGQVGIGTTTPDSNAILDLTATNKALLLPRVAHALDIIAPTNGMIIYDLSTKCLRSFENGAWSLCLSSNNDRPILSFTKDVLVGCTVNPAVYVSGVQITTGVALNSSNTGVATVNSASGSITGVSAGTTNITVTYNGGISTYPITVYNAINQFTSGSGTLAIPYGVTQATVEVYGGGGSGAMGYNPPWPSGGASGAYCSKVITVAYGNTISYSVGTGGAPVTGVVVLGIAGGTSTATYNATTLTATGGSGGKTNLLSTGGVASGGTTNINGNGALISTNSLTAKGGNGVGPGGGIGGLGNAPAATAAGGVIGGGGGAATDNGFVGTTGAGARGQVNVTFSCP